MLGKESLFASSNKLLSLFSVLRLCGPRTRWQGRHSAFPEWRVVRTFCKLIWNLSSVRVIYFFGVVVVSLKRYAFQTLLCHRLRSWGDEYHDTPINPSVIWWHMAHELGSTVVNTFVFLNTSLPVILSLKVHWATCSIPVAGLSFRAEDFISIFTLVLSWKTPQGSCFAPCLQTCVRPREVKVLQGSFANVRPGTRAHSPNSWELFPFLSLKY